jgi:hypothetical protein
MSGSWEKRLEPWFGTRCWRVQIEFDGTVTVGDTKFTYVKGVFDIEPPGVFVSPFGTRARHGIAVIETDIGGQDIPGSAKAFGESVLRQASELFGTIHGLPEKAAEESSG